MDSMAPVIRIQMKPEPLSDLGGVIIVSNMQMATQGRAAEKPILTPWWNCFFDLFFVAFVIIITQKGLPQIILPLCLAVKVPFFRTLSTCGWQEGRNEHISCLRLAILGDVCKINGLFTLLPCLSPSLIYKRTWHPDPVRWLFWGASLPSSWSVTFWIKLFPVLQHLISRMHCPVVQRVEPACLANRSSGWQRGRVLFSKAQERGWSDEKS